MNTIVITQISLIPYYSTSLIIFVISGMYQGGFDLEYPVNVGTWAIVVEAFVSIPI